MASFNHIGGAEPSTLTFKLATVTQTRNSSVMHQELMVISDPDSTLANAAVLATTPGSTAWGLATRAVVRDSTVFQGTSPWIIAGNSTAIIQGNSTVFQGSSAWQVQVTNQTRVSNSTASDLLVQVSGNSSVFQGSSNWQVQVTGKASVINSSAADLLVQISGNSTAVLQGNCTAFQGGAPWSVSQVAGSTWSVRAQNSTAADLLAQISGNSTVFQGTNPWIIAGNSTVAPLAGSTWATRPIQSSAADLQMTATPAAGSTWNVRALQSSAADLQVTATLSVTLQSTAAPSSNSSGLVVRQVVDNLLLTSSTDAFGVGTTSFSIQSSGAGLRSYVTAYSILTTNAGPTKIAFYSSAVMFWPLVLAAVSSAVTGVNLAVSAPAYLFRTGNQEALTLRTKGSSQAGWHVAVSYFRAV